MLEIPNINRFLILISIRQTIYNIRYILILGFRGYWPGAILRIFRMPNSKAPITFPSKKINKAKKNIEKSTYVVMIAEAIKSLNDKSGSSRQAILKHILANNKIDSAKPAVYMCLALNKGVADGTLKMAKATGKGTGLFKIGNQAKEIKETKKPKTKQAVKEAEVKKLAAKKSTEKKVAVKEPPATKPANKKFAAKGIKETKEPKTKQAFKETEVKKLDAKKPTDKKVAAKEPPPKKSADKKQVGKKKYDKKHVGKDSAVKRTPLSLYARAAYESAVRNLSTKKPSDKESSAKVIYMRRLFLPGRSTSTAEIWVPC